MYLAGIDIYDIMKVTGHASPEILKKYIKADNLNVSEKLLLWLGAKVPLDLPQKHRLICRKSSGYAW